MSTSRREAPARRPGGRTAAVQARINDAVLQLVVEGGSDACTFTAVANRAGVERSTVYRRYADRWEMMIEAFMAVAAADVVPDLGDSFAGDLTSVLHKLVVQLESPLGAALVATAAELRASSATDYSRTYFDRRMAQLDQMFEAAVARHELPRTVDREALFTFAAAPIYFRIFIAARGVDEAFIRAVVSSVCWLYCTPSVAAATGLPTRIS